MEVGREFFLEPDRVLARSAARLDPGPELVHEVVDVRRRFGTGGDLIGVYHGTRW